MHTPTRRTHTHQQRHTLTCNCPHMRHNRAGSGPRGTGAAAAAQQNAEGGRSLPLIISVFFFAPFFLSFFRSFFHFFHSFFFSFFLSCRFFASSVFVPSTIQLPPANTSTPWCLAPPFETDIVGVCLFVCVNVCMCVCVLLCVRVCLACSWAPCQTGRRVGVQRAGLGVADAGSGSFRAAAIGCGLPG